MLCNLPCNSRVLAYSHLPFKGQAKSVLDKTISVPEGNSMWLWCRFISQWVLVLRGPQSVWTWDAYNVELVFSRIQKEGPSKMQWSSRSVDAINDFVCLFWHFFTCLIANNSPFSLFRPKYTRPNAPAPMSSPLVQFTGARGSSGSSGNLSFISACCWASSAFQVHSRVDWQQTACLSDPRVVSVPLQGNSFYMLIAFDVLKQWVYIKWSGNLGEHIWNCWEETCSGLRFWLSSPGLCLTSWCATLCGDAGIWSNCKLGLCKTASFMCWNLW